MPNKREHKLDLPRISRWYPKSLVTLNTLLIYVYHKCDKCEYAATEAGSLKRHIESKHEGVSEQPTNL